MIPIQIDSAWKGTSDCRNCGIRDMVLFADLNEQDFGEIHTPIDDMVFAADAPLYTEGQTALGVFTLRKGMVKLVRTTADGRERIVRVLRPGDVIAVARTPAGWALRQPPEISGGFVAEEVATGRVRAMVGGFDARTQAFNRATQANRQPGSTFKPIVYATAMDNGFTPASIVVDGSYCVFQTKLLGTKCFKNFNNMRSAGPQTLRGGLEQSRNLMTVRAAAESGMDNVTDTFRDFGIGDYPDYLSYALGAGDTTVLKMVNAYSMLVNHGRELKPTLIDFAQNRKGKVIFPANWKPCKGCLAKDWNGKPMPRFAAAGKQVMDPITAYQVVHMLEGVIERGTAVTLRELDRPLFGKTGTTTGPTNVWFIGGSPHLVAGLYLGFDQPRNMGGYAQGSSLAAPIFKQFARSAMAGMPKTPFIAPAGTRLVRIDRKSGKRVYGAWPGRDPMSAVIWEAFKAETEPKRSIRQEELSAREDKPKETSETQSNSATRSSASASTSVGTKRDQEFIQQEGGIY